MFNCSLILWLNKHLLCTRKAGKARGAKRKAKGSLLWRKRKRKRKKEEMKGRGKQEEWGLEQKK